MQNPSAVAHPEGRPLGSAPGPLIASAHDSAWSSTGVAGASISREIVHLLRAHTGRGPTKAKTTIASDLVVVALADCLTILEKQLTAEGEAQLVEATRHAIHDGMRAEAVEIVERLAHRPVAACLTAQEHDPDVAIFAFFLAPPSLQVA